MLLTYQPATEPEPDTNPLFSFCVVGGYKCVVVGYRGDTEEPEPAVGF